MSPMMGITRRKENDVPRLVDEEAMKRPLRLPGGCAASA